MFVIDLKTQWICDKVTLEYGGMLMFITDCYKNQNMCDNTVNDYAHALGFVAHCYKDPKNVW